MNKSLLFILGTILSSPALSDFGLGVTLNGRDPLIYLPVNMSKTLKVEPVFGYVRGKEANNQGTKNKNHGTLLGLGIYAQSQIDEGFNLLAGGSLNYIKDTHKHSNENNDYSSKQSLDGFLVSPTIGFEYFAFKNLSIGGDFSINYWTADEDYNNQRHNSEASHEQLYTQSRVIARIYFQ